MNATSLHPTLAELTAFAQGRLDDDARQQIEGHVAECSACCQALLQAPSDTLEAALLGTPALAETMAVAGPGTKTDVPADALGIPEELRDHPRYKIIGRLGEGGMGVVYLAEHRLMDRRVAIKVINHRLLNHPIALERFRLEVKAAARLSHPTIVTAHDAEQAGSLHFLVTEFVDGISLATYVARRGALNGQQAASVVRQVAQGLQHAWERGMVHRDIKPQNLMVTRTGQVKILDFGLARWARAEVASVSTPSDVPAEPGLTMDGVVLGTPDYIAPEQVCDSSNVDTRADIYSLGCTLYFLLTGSTPFQGGTSTERALAHVHRTPRSIRTLRHDLPEELIQILERMMARQPAERFQTPGEVAAALTPLIRGAKKSNQSTYGALDSLVANLPPMGSTPPGMVPAPGMFTPAGLGPVGLEAQLFAAPAAGGFGGAWTGAALAGGTPWDAPAPTTVSRWARWRRRWRSKPFPVAAILVAGLCLLAGLLAFAAPPVIRMALSPASSSSGHDPSAVCPDEPQKYSNPRSMAGAGSRDIQAKRGPTDDNPVLVDGGPNVLLVLPHESFYWPDYAPVNKILTEAKIRVTIASSVVGPARSVGGPEDQTVEATVAIDDVRADDIDAVVFIGKDYQEFTGDAPSAPRTRQLIKELIEQKKYVVGLCAGTSVLYDAGTLQGIAAAPSPFGKEGMMRDQSVHWDWSRSIVESDRIITVTTAEYAADLGWKLRSYLTARYHMDGQ